VYKPEVFIRAAKQLIAEGHLPADYLPETDGYKDPDPNFIDGTVYDGRQPNAYLQKFEIGHRN
jgi:nitrate/nitrite transport system substrate-binding protein